MDKPNVIHSITLKPSSMKKLFTLLLMMSCYAQIIFAQGLDALVTDLNMSFFAKVGDDLDYTKFEGKGIGLTAMYKTKEGATLYTEDHAGNLDDIGGITFQIGTGSNPQPSLLTLDLLTQVATICWSGTVDTDDGLKPFFGMKDVTPTTFASYAYYAGDSKQFNGNFFNTDPGTWDELVESLDNYGLLVRGPVDGNPDENQIQEVELSEFMHLENSLSAVNGNPLEIIRFGADSVSFLPAISFGTGNPTEIESKVSIFTTSSPDFYNGVGIINQPGASPPGHNVASLFVCNGEPLGSVAVHAKANSWAFYGEGNNGLIGISTGQGNGASVWGHIGAAPAAGGYKYAVLGDAQNQPGALAGYFLGGVTITGTLNNPSDANLKNEIRTQTNSLQKVMQLRPTSYTYKQDTPYSLPDGIHYGFIAQEMEEVLPELVSDLNMPLSLDPDKMETSGTASYKGIHYIEMISILTSALQELNTNLTGKIDAQAAEIAELRKMIEEIATKK